MRRSEGFSLIELMIAVAILGIIASIAYPSYTEYVNKSRRADAQGALVSFAGAMERHFTVHSSYCDAGSISPGTCGDTSKGDLGSPGMFAAYAPTDSPAADAYYTLEIESVSATSFELRAVRIAGNPQGNDACGDFTITQTGARGMVNNTQASCWP